VIAAGVLSRMLMLACVGASAVAPARTEGPAVALTSGITWNPRIATPSGDLAIFVGAPLVRRGIRGQASYGAIGYELTLSAGGADYAAAFLSFSRGVGLFYHRHHMAFYGQSRAMKRLFYTIGGGALMWRSTAVALEGDVRLGVWTRLGRRTRARGVFGGHSRLVGVLGGVPQIHLGLFAGVVFR
jgi:hypothetical protein